MAHFSLEKPKRDFGFFPYSKRSDGNMAVHPCTAWPLIFRRAHSVFILGTLAQVMKNAEHWKATKFEQTAKGWRGSRNPQHLAVSSRLSADLAVRAVAASIRKYARGRLLDLGCGAAPLYGLYRDRVDEVICIDWPSSNHDTQYVDTFADLGKGIPHKSASFDTILCTSVLEHIPNPDKMWAEIARVLAPGTRVIALIPFLYPLHEIPHDYFRFTEFKLRQFCEEAGLQVLELKAYGGLLDVLSVLTAKLLSRYRLLCAWFTALCGVMLELTPTRALRRKTSKTFPLGYCLVAEKPGGTG